MASESVATHMDPAARWVELNHLISNAQCEMDMGISVLDMATESESEPQIAAVLHGALVLLRTAEKTLAKIEALAPSMKSMEASP